MPDLLIPGWACEDLNLGPALTVTELLETGYCADDPLVAALREELR